MLRFVIIIFFQAGKLMNTYFSIISRGSINSKNQHMHTHLLFSNGVLFSIFPFQFSIEINSLHIFEPPNAPLGSFLKLFFLYSERSNLAISS